MGYTKNAAVKKALGTVVPYVKPLVDLVPLTSVLVEKVIQEIIDKIDYYKRMRIVPKLYSDLSRDKLIMRLPLDKGVALLEDIGFRVFVHDIPIVDADPKYRRCADNQIIYTEPGAEEKVAPDMPVSVFYITQDVIDRSQEMYEEQEKIKAEKKEQQDELKKQKKEERIAKREQAVADGKQILSDKTEKLANVFHRNSTDEVEVAVED